MEGIKSWKTLNFPSKASPSFDDIEDCYFTENNDKDKMHYNDLEPYFEDSAEAKHMYNSETEDRRMSEIDEILGLVKKDFKPENYK